MKNYLKGITTPLASIFGSGFLVIISVLDGAVGVWSLPAMLAICLLAYAVGSVIRFNIAHVEQSLHDKTAKKSTLWLDNIADIALVPAYIISVTLYLRILSSYALHFFHLDNNLNEQYLTTGVLVSILLLAVIKGLNILEGLEKWALSATVVIIAVLIISFAVYDVGLWQHGAWQLPNTPTKTPWQIITILGGTLIVVQGFETTRYLGEQYTVSERVSACRHSQIISTVVYLLFVGLATPLMHFLGDHITDNGLMEIAKTVAVWLPVPLVLAAIFSQFSAAIADTLGASGNILEFTHHKIRPRWTYLIICGFAIVLTWSANTLEILTLASRAFALYYFLQCLVAFLATQQVGRKVFFAVIAIILLFITLFSVPVS